MFTETLILKCKLPISSLRHAKLIIICKYMITYLHTCLIIEPKPGVDIEQI